MNIIFVCTGNTCRSPMAEGYLKSKNIPWLNVKSCGLFGDGSPVAENAVAVMKEIGVDIKTHISANICKEDILWANRIICLSPSHLNQLLSAGVSQKKLCLLGNGIEDPFGGDISVYKKCRDEIVSAIDKLFEEGVFAEFNISLIKDYQIPAIAKLESICFSEPWSAHAVQDAIKAGHAFLVAENENHVLGYISFKSVLDEGYINNIAVFPSYRRQGIGRALINSAISLAKQKELAFLSLEVRKSNEAAINLYTESGFSVVGERKDFYRNPKENALIMTLSFK